MQDILSESLRRLRKLRIRRKRMISVLLVLSLLVSFDVFWILRQPGWTLAGDADCKITEHTHDDGCIAECPIPEHFHTIECYSDETADAETQLDWQEMFADYPYSGDLAKDLVGIAKTQVGYTESKLNFEVDQNGIRRGYTRYGAWYGTPYSDWSATFVSFCLNYAGADLNAYPANIGASAMAEQWKALGKYADAKDYKPVSGDLVFFSDNTVGIVAEVQTSTCNVIRGDMNGTVLASIVSFTDESIVGWGILSDQIVHNERYDISKGPAVFITANIKSRLKMQTFNLKKTTAVADKKIINLVEYLNREEVGGSYSFILMDVNNHAVPKDENGNYIVHANTLYKIMIVISSPNGFTADIYQYQLPDGVIIDNGLDNNFDDGRFIVNDTLDVGGWSVENNMITMDFNKEVNELSDVVISATMGIYYPNADQEIDFDGKIHVTVEPPREEISVTEVQKWGVQGDTDNENTEDAGLIGKTNPDKIYWNVVIEGNADSQIVGSTLTDRIIKYDWSYDHYFAADDMAKGIKFGVSIYDPADGSEMWHTWTVYPGDPNLISWTETGWEYIMPETIICDKNANGKHEQVLGNEYYTYYVDYTSTPAHIDIAGNLEYRNAIEIDNQRDEVSAYYAHAAVQAAIYKHGTLVTDAQGAKIIWEVQATIPKKTQQKAANYWAIGDNMAIKDAQNNGVYYEGNGLKIDSITANYFGTTINVPHYSVGTENDPYAYETYVWSDGKDNGASIIILQRCTCTEETCKKWSEVTGRCNPWVYDNYAGTKYATDYCDCWNEVEDTTFTVTYVTDVTEEMAQYDGMGYSAENGAGLSSSDLSTLWTQTRVPFPGMIHKEDVEPEGSIVKYNITVNEAKLNLTDGSPLIIHDEMTNTLAFMRGSLFIKAEDAQGNITTLQEGVDYTYTYNDTKTENGVTSHVHVLEVEITHPQPVTYILDYNTMLIAQNAENIENGVTYTNTASITLWGKDFSDTLDEKISPSFSIASNSLKVFVHKLSEETGDPLQGAEFGLFNSRGGLIARSETNADGKAYFQTDVANGVVLREHVIYYIQELRAPPGYQLDDTKYEFTFCNKTDGECDAFEELKELIKVPFKHEGHIDVTNKLLNYDLPGTGGIGVYPIILTSVIFIITPLVYRFIRRRKRERRGVG